MGFVFVAREKVEMREIIKMLFSDFKWQLHSKAPINTSTPPHNPARRCYIARFCMNAELYPVREQSGAEESDRDSDVTLLHYES